MEKSLDRAAKTRLLFVSAKGLGQAVDFDDGHAEFELWISSFSRGI